MEKIAIITDSCSDIKKEYRELYDIHVLPIQIQYDGKSYRDGVDITSNDIYAIQDEKVIKTSSPVGEDLFNLLDQLKDKGYTHVIGLFLSSGISGTGNQMRLFCQTYEKLKCYIVDSQSASVGLGVIAVSLAKYREEGKSFDELIEIATNSGVHYLGFNFPKDVCADCGATGTFDACPECGSHNITRIRRVSGYLEIQDFFTSGKLKESQNRKEN